MARTCVLRAFRLQIPWRFFSGVTFVLFCFVFCLYAFAEAAALRSIVLRYAGAPITTRVSFFYFFSPFLFLFLFGDVAFSEYFVPFPLSLCMDNRVRTFFPSGWCFFYLVTTGWIFYIAYVRIQSINQSINQSNSVQKIRNYLCKLDSTVQSIVY